MKITTLSVILLLVIIGIFIGIFTYITLNYEQDTLKPSLKQNTTQTNQQACINLGCNESTIYTGSINSDKYYPCTCSYAKRIKPENIICFQSKEQAELEGYVWVEC